MAEVGKKENFEIAMKFSKQETKTKIKWMKNSKKLNEILLLLIST